MGVEAQVDSPQRRCGQSAISSLRTTISTCWNVGTKKQLDEGRDAYLKLLTWFWCEKVESRANTNTKLRKTRLNGKVATETGWTPMIERMIDRIEETFRSYVIESQENQGSKLWIFYQKLNLFPGSPLLYQTQVWNRFTADWQGRIWHFWTNRWTAIRSLMQRPNDTNVIMVLRNRL